MTNAPYRDTIAIAPSILASDFLRLGEAIQAVEGAGADRLHIDVMDGRFVPNISMGPPVLECIRSATSLSLEAHLMIVEPEKYSAVFAAAGADVILVHQEVSPHLYRTVQQIHDLEKRSGVVVNPATPWNTIDEVLDIVDQILVMTVNPGFGGQLFIEPMLRKIGKLADQVARRGGRAVIEVDGGISDHNAAQVVRAGARVLVAGTSIFRAPQGVHVAMRELRAAAERGLPGETDVQQ